ncbi:hypothetical protein, variant 2 [Phytophthora nicotianae CJ01A1]|uniref:Phosphoribosyltransferase domain-containing protein n=6 Tax=Phytophthora nicotianae TaxID=4792 RepID=W2R359_PHYN3|nr:hypothetical protein, variant 2 [Phytophthora nicotianae INRA-310]ETI35716.1 hypothetical protein, variant 2 [Phytophthora nicotianae P1569]ETK75964.1 hypothetical protein, variant 2 [Phytophthora nicotianae]ETO64489.1 hypothetical protein, variant 2 [Phytophthora nicotianae P1976]ETP05594.1 hypothetical protein, variant 2 [Phytophthora nicotianae CJ01A1]ETP33658.1 hypothetical protein, variant 2 [Phytophthora nicotianae P10297]
MFLRTVRSHAKLGAAALMGAPMLLSQQQAHAEQRVYASGEALGRGVRLELWKAQHENVVVLDLESELIQLGMTRIRDYENAGAKFTHDANGVLRSTLDLALTELPSDEESVVTTPRGYKAEGLMFEDDVKVCGISIAVNPEAQKGLAQVLRTSLPYDAKYGEILVQEDAKGGNKIAKATLPEDLDGHEVLLLLPELASVSQIDKVIHVRSRVCWFVLESANDTGVICSF